MRLWLIGIEDESLQRGEPSKPSIAYQRRASLPLEGTCVKFSILWDLTGVPHVMLNAVKHPRGTGFFVSLRMTRTPANPKDPKSFAFYFICDKKHKNS